MVAKIREPKNQYDSPLKNAYREIVWSTFSQNIEDVSNAKVLFFPSRHGLEIPIALSYGFHQENLFAVEQNSALIAASQWRKDYPRVNYFGTTLDKAIDKLYSSNIRLDAANLDFCSCLCTGVFQDLHKFLLSEHSIVQPRFLLGITIMKGRESTALIDVAKLVFRQDSGAADRVKIIQTYIQEKGLYTNLLISDEYRSDTKNMVYGVIDIAKLGHIQQITRDYFISIHNEVKSLLMMDDAIRHETCRVIGLQLREQFKERQYQLRAGVDKFFHQINYQLGPLPLASSQEECDWLYLKSIGDRRWSTAPCNCNRRLKICRECKPRWF